MTDPYAGTSLGRTSPEALALETDAIIPGMGDYAKMQAVAEKAAADLRAASPTVDEDALRQAMSSAAARQMVFKDAAPGDTSDGFHTFDELYDHRAALFALLATIAASGEDDSWRSKQHHPDDDPMFEGYFVVGVELPTGTVTYHYKLDRWDNFQGVRELEHAPKWDGHTPADTLERMVQFQGVLAEAVAELRAHRGCVDQVGEGYSLVGVPGNTGFYPEASTETGAEQDTEKFPPPCGTRHGE